MIDRKEYKRRYYHEVYREKQIELSKNWYRNNKKKFLKYLKKWRKDPANIDKIRRYNRISKQNYIEKIEAGIQFSNRGKRWSKKEDNILLNNKEPLRVLIRILKRSYQAISSRKCKLQNR